MNVGFIGLGNMGTRIATQLVDGGHHLTVWARRSVSLAPFAGRAAVAASPAMVAETSDLIGICVWDERDVDEVLLGQGGVLSGIKPGSVIAVHSTISPAGARRLAQEAAGQGAALVDAPVSIGSRSPKLLVMVGGDHGAVERCRAAFDSFGDPVVHLGPVGSGLVAKLVNNTLLAATVALGRDAIALGGQLGMDEGALLTTLASGSSGGTWSSLLAHQHGRGALAGRTNEWAVKDVALTERLAAEAGVDPDRAVLHLATQGAAVLASGSAQT